MTRDGTAPEPALETEIPAPQCLAGFPLICYDGDRSRSELLLFGRNLATNMPKPPRKRSARKTRPTDMTLEEFEAKRNTFPHMDTRVFDVKFKNVSHFETSFPSIYNLYYPADGSRDGDFDIFMKILPEPASRIYSGVKEFELRKYMPRHRGWLFLMETGKVDAVTGCFRFDEVIVDTVPNLWERLGERATSKQRFDSYFGEKQFGAALEIKNVMKFKRQIPVQTLYDQCPDMPRLPHPFVYLYTPVGSTLSNALRSGAREIFG